MISILSTIVVAVSLTSLVSGSAIPNSPSLRRDVGILRLPIRVKTTKNVNKRQSMNPIENVQTGTRYMVDFAIGTPPQLIALSLDTGSSETWVNPNCATALGQANIELCNSFPRYTANASSTAVDLHATKDLTYGKGSSRISYYADNFDLGGAVVTGQQFGVSTISSAMPVGFMGVGPGIELTGYPTVIDSLVTQGFTNSRAFSLDLRSFESPDGAIIFGGIDTAKYTGSLEKLPIIPVSESPDKYPRYWVYMNSLGITKPGEAKKLYSLPSTNPKGLAVFLDSGGTLTRLPSAIVTAILADFPSAVEDGNSGVYQVDCAVADIHGTVDFGFGNTVINVPFQEFMWHISDFCYLGLAADDSLPVLGASFLRAAFVVYDQDNQNLHVANSANCGNNMVAIGKGVDAVPSLTGDCVAASATPAVSNFTSTASRARATPTPLANLAVAVAHAESNGSSTLPASPYSTEDIRKAQNYVTRTTYSTSYATYAGVVTQNIVEYTTICPVAEQATPTPSAPYQHDAKEITKTIYATQTYTISKCAASVTHCPYNQTATVAPVSTTVYTKRYMVATIGGVRVAPYEMIANPVPVAPATPIVYPVPLQSLPGRPLIHTPVTYTPSASTSIPAAELPPVIYKPGDAFPATPLRSLLAAYGTGHPTGSLPNSTSLPFVSAAVTTRGDVWAVALVAVGILVMA
ncbi:hypothetical protein QTJ16_004474 [Diplocarpon rosae]|uniref:Peptidase A1 domain-containing protein n=1 Tax=Diplocarpon rosae TaxID=946125 RepID=A0AAD9T050_9HELO|nr:hypothetical protein QTJ16_004474 [Diplocarpon rosae]